MEAPRVTYRIISGEAEWPKIVEFFGRVGIRRDIIPSWRFARAAVAEFEGEIIACWFMQVAIHIEPLVIDGRHAGRVYLKSLFKQVEEAKRTSVFASLPMFSFVDTSHTKRIAEVCGLDELTGVAIMCKGIKESFASGADMRKEAVNAGVVQQPNGVH